MDFIHRNLQPPQESFFLFGPRGTGKSTWISHTFKDSFRIDLLDTDVQRTYAAYPERLKDDVKKLKRGSFCSIDEVQRVPELLSVVHSLMNQSY